MRRSISTVDVSDRSEALRIGFLPVNDCAPLVVAEELGFFSKYALKVELVRHKSWADIRDGIVERSLDAAQVPATMPLMMSAGVQSEPCACVSGLVMSLSGSTITLSRPLWERGLHRQLHLSRDVVHQKARLCFGVPYLGSTQDFLMRRWIQASGLNPELDVRIVVIPPAQMFPTLKLGYIDGYCVDEPWSSVAVQAGAGVCVATSSQLTPLHPEKVLMTREDFVANRPDAQDRLTAALIEACEFCDRPWNRKSVATLLANPQYIDAPRDCILPGILGPFSTWDGRNNHPMGLNTFHRFQANEPNSFKLDWIVSQLSQSPPAGYTLVRRHLSNLAKHVYSSRLYLRGATVAKTYARKPVRRTGVRVAAPAASLAA